MKKSSDNGSNRRKFLTLGLLGGAGLISQSATAMLPIQPEDETVPMLTPDGKLVGVSKRVLDQIKDRKKAGSDDIHNWTTPQNKTDQ